MCNKPVRGLEPYSLQDGNDHQIALVYLCSECSAKLDKGFNDETRRVRIRLEKGKEKE